MEFINITTTRQGGVEDVLQVGKTNRHRIRVQVMKDFRRKEQKQKSLVRCSIKFGDAMAILS
jgi:hypothetical protein